MTVGVRDSMIAMIRNHFVNRLHVDAVSYETFCLMLDDESATGMSEMMAHCNYSDAEGSNIKRVGYISAIAADRYYTRMSLARHFIKTIELHEEDFVKLELVKLSVLLVGFEQVRLEEVSMYLREYSLARQWTIDESIYLWLSKKSRDVLDELDHLYKQKVGRGITVK